MTLDAVIFDLDGTLVDTELLWADAMGLYLDSRHCDCPRETLLSIVFGRSWTDIYRDLTARYPSLAST
jgi:beta-phosphoglucomutase-like phosphatase (HAD superfamily)